MSVRVRVGAWGGGGRAGTDLRVTSHQLGAAERNRQGATEHMYYNITQALPHHVD